MVWINEEFPGEEIGDIFFAFSTDNGQTFSTPDNLSESGLSSPPQISSSGNNVYVVWSENTPGNNEIFFAFSTDNGQTFSSPKNISESTGGSGTPQISSSENNVYITWVDGTPGNADIFFAFSTNNGQTFSTPDNLSEDSTSSSQPQISSEGNNVYVVWTNFNPGNQDIFFAFSTNNGQTFSTPDNLTENIGSSGSPQISSEGNNVYVVWQGFLSATNGEIFFAVSTDNGQTFSDPDNLSESTENSTQPQISSEGNNVYVVWTDSTPGNFDIFFAVSTDNGQTFSDPDNLSENTGGSSSPQISSEGNNIYVVWADSTPGNQDIFFIANNELFGLFGNILNLSNNAGDSERPQISSSP